MIPYQENVFTINELCHHLNTNFQHVFPKMVSRYDVKKWIKNKDLITLKVSDNIPEELIHLKAVEDFLFRFEKGYLCNYESVKYYKACEISSEFKSLLETILEDDSLRNPFQKMVCFIALFHPYALFNDPLLTYSDLGRCEGGILFKNAGVTFQPMSTLDYKYLHDFEKPYFWCDDTLYYYPIIVADAINSLLTVCDRIGVLYDALSYKMMYAAALMVIKTKKLGEPGAIELEFEVFMNNEKGFRDGWYGLSTIQLKTMFDSLLIRNRTPRLRFD